MTTLRRATVACVITAALAVAANMAIAPRAALGASARCAFGPGARDTAPTRIEVWTTLSPEDTDTVKRLAREFERAQPGVRVKVVTKGAPLETADEYFNTPVAERPAAVMLPGTATQAAVETGAVTQLAPCSTGSGPVVDHILPGALAGTTVDGQPWGVPFGASAWVLVYDRAAFVRAGLDPNRPPRTLDEVSAASRALVASGAVRHGLLVTDPTPLAIAAGALGTDSAAQRDALLRWEADTRAGGLTTGARVGDLDTAAPGINALVTKEAGMAIESTLALPAAVHALRQGQAPGLELGIAAVPSPSGPTTPFESYSWYLASGTPRVERDAGWAFVDWLSQPEQQARIGGTTEFFPANGSVTATTPVDRWTTEPDLKQAWSVITASPPSAAVPSGALRDRQIALAMAFWSLFIHDAPVDTALADVATRTTESDAFYTRSPSHYAQCGFGRPPCVGDIELYSVAVDDGGERAVGRNVAGDAPVISPDGTRVAFSTGGPDGTESHLVVMNTDGTHRVQLTNGSGVDRHPSWSPDGTRLVFQRGETNQGGDVYVIDAETAKTTRLTSGDAVDQQPTWSPDGTRIAYGSNRGGSFDLWIMKADGSDPDQVASHPANDWWPAWSPDGSQLAFMTDRDGDIAVYLVKVDGSNEHRLVGAASSVPSWSPNGRSIAVVDNLTGEVYLVAADGSSARQLTTTRGGNFAPSWSPDGTRLVLGGTRRG